MRITFDKYDKMAVLSNLKESRFQRNKHSQDQIERLAKIMKEHGVRQPIHVHKKYGEIAFGHGRKEAALLNGWKKYPIVYQDFASDEEYYATVQSDNAIASWAELDLSAISIDIGKLGPQFDLDLLGIKDIAGMMPAKEPGCDEDEVPEPKESICKLGDIWQLGSHRLMCGDSTSIDAVEKLMNGQIADMVFTSPPYNAGTPVRTSNKVDSFYKNDSDDKSQESYSDFLSGFVNACMPFSRYQFINLQMLANNKIALIDWLNKYRNHIADVGIWDKGHAPPQMAAHVLNSRFEFVFILSSEKDPNRAIKIANFHGDKDNVYAKSRGEKNEFAKIHGATFPVHLPEYWIGITDAKLVLEPFAGSGSTCIACEKTNRKCFMMELDPHYCDVIIARWEKYTGQKAENVS